MIIRLLLSFTITLPSLFYAQEQYGWNIYKSDSLWVHSKWGNGTVETIGKYTNGQVKYIRHSTYSGGRMIQQIQDTVEYYDRHGSLISKVHYKTLFHELYDSTFKKNYAFVESALSLSNKQIVNSFKGSGLWDYVSLDPDNSYQKSPLFNKFSVQITNLYEPVSYDVLGCVITYNSRSTQLHSNSRIAIYLTIDTSMKIIQSNIDLNRQYTLKFDREFADSVRLQRKFIEGVNLNQKRGIRVTGPDLELRRREFYWVIRKQAGKLLLESDLVQGSDLDYFMGDSYVEELTINVETGEIQTTLEYIGSMH